MVWNIMEETIDVLDTNISLSLSADIDEVVGLEVYVNGKLRFGCLNPFDMWYIRGWQKRCYAVVHEIDEFVWMIWIV